MNIKLFGKAILFSIISALASTPLQILNSIYVLGEEGPPDSSFLIPIGIISIIMKTLYAIAYILMGNKLPIKNPRLKAFSFIALIWISDYIPQVMGLIGADGPIAEVAFNFPILICDSLAYVIDGILLGFIIKDESYCKPIPCKKWALLKTSSISALMFPCFVIIFDQILGFLYEPLRCHEAIQVSDEKIIIFYIYFYGCFIVTGALLPLFYRLTEYNTGKGNSPIRFGMIFSLCLWAPVVAIMIAFGTEIISTFIFVVIFFICIMAVALINANLIKRFDNK